MGKRLGCGASLALLGMTFSLPRWVSACLCKVLYLLLNIFPHPLVYLGVMRRGVRV